MAKRKESLYEKEWATLVALLSGFKPNTKFHSRSNRTGYLTNSLDKQVKTFLQLSKDRQIQKLFKFHNSQCQIFEFFFNLYIMDDIGLENWGLDFDFVISKKMPKKAKEAREILGDERFESLRETGLKKFKTKD